MRIHNMIAKKKENHQHQAEIGSRAFVLAEIKRNVYENKVTGLKVVFITDLEDYVFTRAQYLEFLRSRRGKPDLIVAAHEAFRSKEVEEFVKESSYFDDDNL